MRLRFPETVEELRNIVLMNVNGQAVDRALVDAASAAFQEIRKTALGATRKPPSTSELIDWVRILYWSGIKPEALGEKPCLPPHWETLFKTGEDLDAYAAAAQKNP